MNFIEEAWNDFDLTRSNVPEPTKTTYCCKESYFTELEGCTVCVNCGVVFSVGIIDDTPDFCEFSQVSHTKTSTFFPKSSGSTTMSGKSNLSRIQNWNSMPYNERVLWEISNLLKSKLNDYFQPRIIDDAIANFKVLDEKKNADGKKEIHRGKIRDGLIASCVYFACKSRGINKTPEEIAKIMEIDVTTFNKCTKIYNRLTDTKQELVKSTDFVDTYYNSISSDYSVSYKIQSTTKKISEAVEELSLLDGTIPQNITAGCILFTSNEMSLGIDPKIFVKKFSISLNTLNKITAVITANKSKIYKNIIDKKKN